MGAELQEHIQADFQALRSFLLEEEASLLEQLRREQEEWEQALQRHLESVEGALRDVEQTVEVLQQAADARDHTVLVEVTTCAQLWLLFISLFVICLFSFILGLLPLWRLGQDRPGSWWERERRIRK